MWKTPAFQTFSRFWLICRFTNISNFANELSREQRRCSNSGVKFHECGYEQPIKLSVSQNALVTVLHGIAFLHIISIQWRHQHLLSDQQCWRISIGCNGRLTTLVVAIKLASTKSSPGASGNANYFWVLFECRISWQAFPISLP
jgi:hypothetical protein